MKVGEVAQLAGISVRTLHHYDQLGLVSPSDRSASGYRLYLANDIDRLQEVLFFRELGFALEQIKEMIEEPGYDRAGALAKQRRLVERKAERLLNMMDALDRAIEATRQGIDMDPKEKLEVFGDFDPDIYEEETKERWGEYRGLQGVGPPHLLVHQGRLDSSEGRGQADRPRPIGLDGRGCRSHQRRGDGPCRRTSATHFPLVLRLPQVIPRRARRDVSSPMSASKKTSTKRGRGWPSTCRLQLRPTPPASAGQPVSATSRLSARPRPLRPCGSPRRDGLLPGRPPRRFLCPSRAASVRGFPSSRSDCGGRPDAASFLSKVSVMSITRSGSRSPTQTSPNGVRLKPLRQ